MERKINKMYRGDATLIIVFATFLWLVLIYAMFVVSSLAPNYTVRIAAVSAAIVACGAATTALFAVLAHLKKNKQELYSEDIMWSYAIGKQKP